MKLPLKNIKRVVIKVGSNLLTHNRGLRKSFFKDLCDQVNYLKRKNVEVVIVSSGAIATAMAENKLKTKPTNISELQALAAIGQPLLINHYAKEFNKKKMGVAQVLLTQDDLDNRERFLNAKHALEALFKRKVVPIVNENDTVTVNEIKIGDNDQLSAHVAHLINADLLVIFSHVEGLYDQDPDSKDAKFITEVKKITKKIEGYVYPSEDQKSVGGMATKLLAASIATNYGIPVVVTSGFQTGGMKKLFTGKLTGTHFLPQTALKARKHWIRHIKRPKGKIMVNVCAVDVLVKGKKSLLSVGIEKVTGNFQIGDCVEICSPKGRLLGKGLSSYTSKEVCKIAGLKSAQIVKALGYSHGDEVVHRDDMVLSKG